MIFTLAGETKVPLAAFVILPESTPVWAKIGNVRMKEIKNRRNDFILLKFDNTKQQQKLNK